LLFNIFRNSLKKNKRSEFLLQRGFLLPLPALAVLVFLHPSLVCVGPGFQAEGDKNLLEEPLVPAM